MSVQTTWRRPQITPPMIVLGILLILGWMIPLFVPELKTTLSSFKLTQATFGQGQVWAVATYVFLPTTFIGLFFDLLLLSFFGEDTRRTLGTGRWIAMLILSTLVGGALSALSLWLFSSNFILGGLHAPITAMLVVYCLQFWRTPLSFFGVDLDGRKLLALFLGLDLIFALMGDFSLFFNSAGGALAGAFIGLKLYDLKAMKSRYSYWNVRRNLRVISSTPEDHPRAPDRKLKNKRRKLDDGTWLN